MTKNRKERDANSQIQLSDWATTNNLACEKKKKKEMDVEGEWASLKGKGGVGGRHTGVKLSFEKSNPEIRNFSVSASDLIGIYK